MNVVILICAFTPLILAIFYKLGKENGIKIERQRVHEIFYSSFSVIHGGSISILWQCINGNTTTSKMKKELVKNVRERKSGLD